MINILTSTLTQAGVNPAASGGGLGGLLSKEVAHRLKESFPDATILVFVRSQPRIIAAAYAQYVKGGGTYSPDCGNSAAPQVHIAADGLQISASGKNVSTPARMDSYTSFGGAPTSAVPEGYKVEFIGDDFSLYVFEDAKGTYVPLEGYVPSAAAVVGGSAMKSRFGHCAGT